MEPQDSPRFSRNTYFFLAGLTVLAGLAIVLIVRRFQPPPLGGQTIPTRSGPSAGTERGTTMVSFGSFEEPEWSVQLSEGQARPAAVDRAPLAEGIPLSEAEIQQILARLPELPPGEQAEFHLAGGPIPPPRPGQTVNEPFPAPEAGASAPEVPAGPLQVLRFAPEGEIKLAPFVQVTFNQPMVPLATLSDLAAVQPPVQLEPAIPGTWRWLGTKTLTFQHDPAQVDRLPMATQYRVTIPAGTRSAAGAELAETVSWTFTTPPPTVITAYPDPSPQPLDPIFFYAFDQRINPAAVLETVRVTAAGQPVSLALATEAEVQADAAVSSLVKNTGQGRWLAFRATAPLPVDSEIAIEIGPGTPSAEGPMTTQAVQSYSFRTYAPLRVVNYGCYWSASGDCRPLEPFTIQFNNPLDTEAFQDAWVKVEPELPGAFTNLYGSNLQIQGSSRGQTTYTVTLSGEIQDTFGQKLGQEIRLAFKVGSAEPQLFGPGKFLVTLDPAAQKPVFSVYALNYPTLDVRIYAVQPSDWIAFADYYNQFNSNNANVQPPGRLVYDQTLRLEAAADALAEAAIDLSPYMDGSSGQFIVIVQPPRTLFNTHPERIWQTVHAWVQVTGIGLDAYTDHSEMVAWATGLKDGAPLAGVEITAGPGGATVQTGSDGTARFPIPSGAAYLVARQGSDQALLPRSSYPWYDQGWQPQPVNDELRWYVFDDRAIYRPGEEVHVKGWLRRIGGKQDGDVGLAAGVTGLNYNLVDPQGNQLLNGRAEVNSLGGFDLAFTLPEAVNLGYAQLYLNAEGDLGGMVNTNISHAFQIQEFRTPEFEVTARNETPGPYFTGGSAVVALKAAYYAGGPLPNAEVTWQVYKSKGSYQPPHWPDFNFGTWTPWWIHAREEAAWGFGNPYGQPEEVETFTGTTDAGGEHYLQLDFTASGEPQPLSLRAEGTVMDVNRQAWTGTTTLLVHPAELYVGLRSDRYFVDKGTPLKIDLIVVDLDGNAVSGRPVQVTAARLEWKNKNGTWTEEAVEPQECSVSSAQEPVACTFQTPVGGSYRITAAIADDAGRPNQSQITRWVSGGELPPAREVEQEDVTLVPDKESYQPGETARILVQAPFSPAEGLLTANRSGIVFTQRFSLPEGSAVLEIPILEGYIPNLHLQVDVNGSAVRSDDQGEPLPTVPRRPAYATGSLELEIPPLSRTLDVQASLQAGELEPGGETVLDLAVLDAAGQPVPDAELAVVVVDEAILALTAYDPADPLGVFYAQRPAILESRYGRESIVLTDPRTLLNQAPDGGVAQTKEVSRQALSAEAPAAMEAAMAAPAPTAAGGAMMDQSAQPQPIRTRVDFNPLAVFAPAVRTDAGGRAQVPVKVPDNLTRYRVMVVAVAGGQSFGQAEASLTARLPLMARPSAPRFLNFGDRFELPVVLQNQTDAPLEVDVVVRASNLRLTAGQGQRVTVPPRDRVEVRFPAETDLAGQVSLQVAAVSGDFADATTIDLPVYTPATTEAFATYGVIDEGAIAQPVASPSGVFPQYGGLEITTSSTALQALTDAYLYLVTYPFECSEQLASRILAVAALKDVLAAFQAEGLPSPEEIQSVVQHDLERLGGMQNDDGGFPYWQRYYDSVPFNSIHAAHALLRAQAMGFSVPDGALDRAIGYLREIENHYPAWYSQRVRWVLSSYALNVRYQAGDRDPEKALRLIGEAGLENLPMIATGWLWPVLSGAPGADAQLAAIRRHVENRVVETPGAANFTTDYDDQTYLLLDSDRRTDAVLLEALMVDSPQHDLIPKLVNGLLAHKKQGRWANTQENVFILLALDHYFKAYEAQTPDFVARVWLGETYAGEHEFRGRTTERSEIDVPMSYLAEAGAGTIQNLVLSKEGPGRLYYRLGLRYAPTSLDLPPVDMGFVVQRTYEAVDNPEDVTRDAEGTWHIKAGARVRVRLKMVADNRRYHVALADPLPAGLEIVNPGLAVSGSTPQDANSQENKYGWWWYWTWYEHQNLRDERAEAFTSLLWDGVYEYTYIARATTPGTFVVPPAKAEEMYSPEVFGRSASDRVIVE